MLQDPAKEVVVMRYGLVELVKHYVQFVVMFAQALQDASHEAH